MPRAEADNASMLKKTAHNALHVDVLGDAGNSRAQATAITTSLITQQITRPYLAILFTELNKLILMENLLIVRCVI